MSLKTVYSAESWDKVFSAFTQVNFTSFDFNSIKQSLIDYSKIYYSESFNDLIESSEFIQLIESFAYIAEQLSYRIDMLSHESFLTTAKRKQSILKLAKLISYKPTRNVAARGLVKLTTISTTETTIDSNGNNLAKNIIIWNDTNNNNWKEQFFLIINKTLTSKIGQFNNSVQIGDVSFQSYTFNNTTSSLRNGVFAFSVNTGVESFPMEVVSCNIDTNGPFEKTPDINSQLSFLYSSDSLGDNSDYTGFHLLLKQGNLSRINHSFNEHIPNRSLDINLNNINETDVWLNQVDANGSIVGVWDQITSLLDQNISFNITENRKKFEVETLENDKIKLIFGDGDFSEIPYGDFHIWTRQSVNKSVVIQPNKITNQAFSFQYTSSTGTIETCSLTFSLLSTIQNSAQSESIEHIRQAAPATYYAQNRMVNAQDYNTFMLKDQSILRLNSINRTFAGQPKYIDWNDASGQYENIKLFGDDLTISQEISINTINTNSTVSSRSLIDSVIEPLLSSNGIINLLNFINATTEETKDIISIPRRYFIEDNRGFYFDGQGNRSTLKEKTLIQGMIDQHWYGEPLSYVLIPAGTGTNYAVIQDPILHPEDDGLIWSSNISRTIDGLNPYIPGDVGSGLQPQSWQENFGLCFNRKTPIIGRNLLFTLDNITSRISKDSLWYAQEVITIEVAANNTTLFVTSSIRGSLGTIEIGHAFLENSSNSVIQFTLIQSATVDVKLYHGDTIKIELKEILKSEWDNVAFDKSAVLDSLITAIDNTTYKISTLNILGRWEIINGIDLIGADNANAINPNNLPFDPSLYLSNGKRNPNSWVIWVKAILNPVTQEPTNFIVNYREVSLKVSSINTKFWYNSNSQLMDSVTKNPVRDQIRILRSNLRPDGKPVGYKGEEKTLGKYIGHNEIYDVVGPVRDSNGEIDAHSLEVMASDALKVQASGDLLPDNILQFERFTDASNNGSEFYVYYLLDQFGSEVIGTETTILPIGTDFRPGSFVSVNGGVGRKLARPNLDFMWQHFTGFSNIIDPSVSNIHDTYMITKGYYDNMISYLRGLYDYYPTPPTPLELRNQYGYLLEQKMISDTVVLHSGKFKLLFGELAEPQLRAIFKVVKSGTATLPVERIKTEILAVINEYFSLQNWDFGETFYVTELIGLIHQKLPTEIASVVLVPTFAVNSFGSLFVVQAGLDEILLSAATINDIEIVSELNPSTLRQGKI
jgi:hypothetical protein